jgi:hypothetical protein
MYVVSFEEYSLVPRYDGKKWTQARIEEAVADTGPWVAIETKPITDYTDPENPPIQNFTTELATLEDGWYRIVFLDATGDSEQPTAPLSRSPDQELDYMCTVSDVGALLRARTKDKNGNELGTFNDDTRPTDEAVQRFIQWAANKLSVRIGVNIHPTFFREASHLVAVYAAMLTELSYWPEQVERNMSPYEKYKELYTMNSDYLVEATQALPPEGELPVAVSGHGYWYAPPPYNWESII